jgi:hypothetical protein
VHVTCEATTSSAPRKASRRGKSQTQPHSTTRLNACTHARTHARWPASCPLGNTATCCRQPRRILTKSVFNYSSNDSCSHRTVAPAVASVAWACAHLRKSSELLPAAGSAGTHTKNESGTGQNSPRAKFHRTRMPSIASVTFTWHPSRDLEVPRSSRQRARSDQHITSLHISLMRFVLR